MNSRAIPSMSHSKYRTEDSKQMKIQLAKRFSEQQRDSAHHHEVVQQAGNFRARRGSDHVLRKWRDEVVYFEAQTKTLRADLDAGAGAGQAGGLVRIRQQRQAAERLRDSGRAGAAINFHAAAPSDE